MIRRRLIIEWDSNDKQTEEECHKELIENDQINDLLECKTLNIKSWVEDAPSAFGAVLSEPTAKAKE